MGVDEGKPARKLLCRLGIGGDGLARFPGGRGYLVAVAADADFEVLLPVGQTRA